MANLLPATTFIGFELGSKARSLFSRNKGKIMGCKKTLGGRPVGRMLKMPELGALNESSGM